MGMFDDILAQKQGTPAGLFDDILGPPKPKVGVAEDVAKSAGSGLLKGAVGLATAPIDMPKVAGEYGVSWLLAKAAEKAGLMPKGKTAEDFVKSAQETFGGPELAGPKVQKWIHDAGVPDYEPQTRAGRYVESVGEVAPMIAAGPGGLLQKGVQSIGAGVGSEAASEAAKGTKYETAARIAGGIAGGLTPNAAARVVTPFPVSASRAPLIATLDREGVPMTAGQKTGNRGLQYMESTLSDMPFGGGKARQIEESQKQAYTEAATKRAGMNGPATPENMADNYDRLGQQFETLGARNTLRMDPQFGQEIGQVASDYAATVAPSQRAPGFQKFVDDIRNIAASGGALPGDTYNAWRSRLGMLARGTSKPEDARAFAGLQEALDAAMERSASPADAAAFRQTRREYANYKTIEKAAGGAGASTAEGNISPAQLRTAVASGKNRGKYVRGQGDLAELARAGVGVLSPLPNSGTPARLAAQGLLSAPGAALGALSGGAPGAAIGTVLAPLLPALAGRGLMSRPVQAYLGNQLLKEGFAPNEARALGLLMLSNPELRDQFAR